MRTTDRGTGGQYLPEGAFKIQWRTSLNNWRPGSGRVIVCCGAFEEAGQIHDSANRRPKHEHDNVADRMTRAGHRIALHIAAQGYFFAGHLGESRSGCIPRLLQCQHSFRTLEVFSSASQQCPFLGDVLRDAYCVITRAVLVRAGSFTMTVDAILRWSTIPTCRILPSSMMTEFCFRLHLLTLRHGIRRLRSAGGRYHSRFPPTVLPE